MSRQRTGQALAALLLAAACGLPSLASGHPASFAELVERASPAVVVISSVGEAVDGGFPFESLPDGHELRERIEDYLDRQGNVPQQRGRLPFEGQGTGFVVDPAGYIVTNDHVIGGADGVTLVTINGRSHEAEVIGTDPKTDIALIRIEAGYDLPYISFGDSDQVRVGDWVVAIGNQFGFSSTVSVGVISARNRDINAGPYDDYIQTDAAINFGSSGGPLLNLDGEVIGVNTAILAPTGTSAGLAFAVPSAMASEVVRQLRENGEVRRGWLGVVVLNMDPGLAEELGMEVASGVFVSDVLADSPAEMAGLRPGDVILRFDGREVNLVRDFPRMVAETAVGREVEMEIWRGGPLRLSTTLGLLAEIPPVAAGAGRDGPDTGSPGDRVVLGMQLQMLDDSLRTEFGIDGSGRGVIVAGVEAGSAAEAAGVRPGFLVTRVGRVDVASPADVARQVEAARAGGDETVVVLFSHLGDHKYYPIRLNP